MKLNERIRAWRRSRAGLTSAALARACGVSRQAAIQWEAGATTPTVANLERIAAAIGVSLSVFYGNPPPAQRGSRP